MPGNSREMITMAERRFPVRIRITVPPGGLGQRYARMTAWLARIAEPTDGDDTVRDAWRAHDAASIYFFDTTLAGVARWCAGYRVETAGGVFQVRDDDPVPRVGARLHRTP
jgi:hypothetical protein